MGYATKRVKRARHNLTHIEEAVEALPVDYQQRMARFALAGWIFEPPNTQVRTWLVWRSYRDPQHGYASGTLLTLLDRMIIAELPE